MLTICIVMVQITIKMENLNLYHECGGSMLLRVNRYPEDSGSMFL
jgi:hypothetical protein